MTIKFTRKLQRELNCWVQKYGRALVQVVEIVADSFTAINMVFREVWDSVEEEGRVPLDEVDRQLLVEWLVATDSSSPVCLERAATSFFIWPT